MPTLLAELKNQKGKKMQSKNALSNLKNRYVAVLKKCALLNVFGTLAVATMLTSPFMASEALAADNAKDKTVISMDATDGSFQSGNFQGPALNSPILNNYGNINGGGIYYNGSTNIKAGMFGDNTGSIDYAFNNSGTITVSSTGEIYGMHANAQNNGNHVFTNSGSIKVSATGNFVYGMHALAQNNGNHVFTNSGTITVSTTGTHAYGMYAYADKNGSHNLTNSGTITVSTTGSYAYGMHASGDGNHTFSNSGTLIVNGSYNLRGIYARGDGNHTFTNSGTITMSGKSDVNAMFSYGNGNHTFTNSGVITVSGTAEVNGMYVQGNGTHLLNNTGIITAKASTGSAFETYGENDYTVGTWATTLRTWTPTDSVFGGSTSTVDVNLADSILIFRPQVNNNVVELNKDYALTNLVSINNTATATQFGTVTTEVPFLKAVVTGGNTTDTAKVRLDTNINKDTTPGDTTVQGNLALVQGQMSNITRKLLQTKYNEIYIDLVSDNGNSGIAAGSEMAENKWTAFLTPYGSYTNNSEYNFDGSQMGVTGGASYNFSEKFSLGAHFDFNYAELDADIMDMDSDSTSFAFGLHANYNIMPQWYVSAQATGSISQIENEYSLTTGTSTKADYDSQALYFALNSGYVFEVAKGHTLTPQIGFSYLNMHTDAYDVDWATGYSMYDMEYDSTSYSAFYADVAFNWHSVWQLENNSAISLLASVGLRQNLSGSDIESDFRLLGGDYSTRTSADDTTFTASIGTQWTKNNFSISAEYNGEYGSEQQIHGGSVEFKYHF